MNVFVRLLAAKPSVSRSGARKAIDGMFCKTILLLAGVTKSGSISRSSTMPVLSVPVSVPKLVRKDSIS